MPQFAVYPGSTPLSPAPLGSQSPWGEFPSPVDWIKDILHFSCLCFYGHLSDFIAQAWFHRAISLLRDVPQLPQLLDLGVKASWPYITPIMNHNLVSLTEVPNALPFHRVLAQTTPNHCISKGLSPFLWVSFNAELKILCLCDSGPHRLRVNAFLLPSPFMLYRE